MEIHNINSSKINFRNYYNSHYSYAPSKLMPEDSVCFSGNLNGENKVKLSVIIPVYNMEKYLKKALTSLKNQTLKDIEFICVDGGSTDKSLDILTNYAAKDKRFKVFTQKNESTGYARNTALKFAKGEYIVFMDPDDWFDNNAFEILYTKAKEQDCDMLAFNYKMVYEDKIPAKNMYLQDILKDTYKLDENECFSWKDIKPKALYGLYYAAWNKIYKNDFIKKYNLHFTPCCMSEDKEFVVGATINAQKIGYCEKPFYNYLQRKNSAVHKYSDKNFCAFDVFKAVQKVIENAGLSEELHDEFNKSIVSNTLHQFERIPDKLKARYIQMCKDILPKEISDEVLDDINKKVSGNQSEPRITIFKKIINFAKSIFQKINTGDK